MCISTGHVSGLDDYGRVHSNRWAGAQGHRFKRLYTAGFRVENLTRLHDLRLILTAG